MLLENDIVDAVATHLKCQGYEVSYCHAHQRGHDIDAVHPMHPRLLIEAKGEGSSKSTSKRYGKAFTRNQVNDHVGRAILRALHFLSKDTDSGIALPDNENHRREILPIASHLKKLGIRIFLVNSTQDVSEI